MLGFSGAEILVILIVAIIFVDPKDLPGVIRSVTDFIKKVKSIGTEFTDIINRELEEPKKYIKDLKGEMQPTYDISDIKTTQGAKEKSPPAPSPSPAQTDEK